MADYQTEQEQLDKEILKLQNELKKHESSDVNVETFKEKLKEFADFKELTSTMIEQLIERIEVFHKKEVNGENVREVKIIYYRFIGTF